MKILAFILVSFLGLSFSGEEISDDISNALKQGNTIELVKYFADKVSVKVVNQEDLLSKAHAQVIIEDFFLRNKVRSFQTSHTSVVNGNQQFITGTLDTSNGKFRISILVRGSQISQFRIEKDNE
jgi:hypothetical protein